jgi:stage V sporulation protein G
MQISEIRIKLVGNRSDRLKAFCSVTFDNSFVIRDLKIIEGSDGYFVAMPSRKLMDRCHACGAKNHLRAKFCNECGARLDENRARGRGGPRTKMHADVAHPINQESREYIQEEIVKSFEKELELSKQPGYEPPKMDAEEDFAAEAPPEESDRKAQEASTPEASAPEPAPEPEPAQTEDETKSGSDAFGEGIG